MLRKHINLFDLPNISVNEDEDFEYIPKIKTIDINDYMFIYRTNGEVESVTAEVVKSKTLDKQVIEEITEFLIKEYPTILESAFGNPKKKNELKAIIDEHVSKHPHLIRKGYTLSEMSTDLVNDIVGLSKIDTIIEEGNGEVTDIMFNGTELWVQTVSKKPHLSQYQLTADEIHVLVNKIANTSKKTFNVENPDLDTQLSSMRINAMHKEISPYGTSLAIRIFSTDLKLSEENFVSTLGNKEILDFLIACVKARRNIFITGETGAGKTELLRFLAGYVKPHHVIDVLEDTLETDLKRVYPHLNITNWVTRDAETSKEEGQAMTVNRLMRSAKRNNPNWIFITETRGGEAMDIIKAALSGHSIITTGHSNSTETSANSLLLMAKENTDLPAPMVSELISEAFDICVHIKLDDETRERKIAGVGEYLGCENGRVIVRNIFEHEVVETKLITNEETGLSEFEVKKAHMKKNNISNRLAKILLDEKTLNPNILDLISTDFKKNVMKLKDSEIQNKVKNIAVNI